MADRVRVGVLISGRGSNMAALLYASRTPDCPYEIVLVVSNDPAAPGLALASAEGIATFAHSHKGLPRAAFDRIIDSALHDAGVEQVALAGYMRLLSPEFIAGWEGRIVNIHPSLLPAYKGLDTHARALAAGDTQAGCSVHVVTPALDDGPVLAQTRVAVLPGDTPETLAARVLIAEHQLYPRMLAWYVRRAGDPAALLAEMRALASALPGSAERKSHGMTGFHIVGGRFFAYFTDNHHGDGMCAALVKTAGTEEQAMLIDADPDLYFRPAYLGASGWIGLRLDRGRIDWNHVAERMTASWRMVAPRGLADVL